MKANKMSFFAAAFILTPLLLFAQVDEKNMQRDITILEDVLNDLLSPEGAPTQVSSRGLYLDGYGVIFNVNYGGGNHFSFGGDFGADLNVVRKSYTEARQELAAAREEQAREKEQAEELARELAKSEQVLAQANEEMARVREEIAKANQEMAKANQEMARQHEAGAAAEDLRKAHSEGRALAALFGGRPDSLSAKKAREIVAGLKKNLTLFYADYAQGLRQLPAAERITVLVNFEGAPAFWGWPGQDERSERKDFYVSLAKSELPALRQSRNPESMLRFQEAKANEAIDRELEIFTGILRKAVGDQAGNAPWDGSGTRSMYVPGYGTIVLLSSSYFNLANMEALKEYAAQAAAGGDKKWGASTGIASPGESWKKKMPELKEQIIEQMARYGGSLRSLKADENIMVVLSSRQGFWGDDRAPSISIAARMSNINKIFNDEISLQAFKNTLAIQEY